MTPSSGGSPGGSLFANAVDALAHRPDPTVTVRTAAVDGIVQLRIEDNGCGIGVADLSDLFKPFRTTKCSGTGLGLVIARRMISRFGGSIEVRSRLNEGTEVVLSLRPAAARDCGGRGDLRPDRPPGRSARNRRGSSRRA